MKRGEEQTVGHPVGRSALQKYFSTVVSAAMLEKTGGVRVAEFVMEPGKEMQVYIKRNYICTWRVSVKLECLILHKYFLIYLTLCLFF